MDETMIQTIDETILNFIGVFLQFCFLSVSKKAKNYQTAEGKTTQNITKYLTKQKDKLMRGVGCKPHKNTFYAFVENKTNAPKSGYSMPFF